MLKYLTCYTLGFCVLSTTGIVDSYVFSWGGGVVHRGMFQSLFGLHQLNAGSSLLLLR